LVGIMTGNKLGAAPWLLEGTRHLRETPYAPKKDALGIGFSRSTEGPVWTDDLVDRRNLVACQIQVVKDLGLGGGVKSRPPSRVTLHGAQFSALNTLPKFSVVEDFSQNPGIHLE
jgi:hypothetical protein